jgi:anti-anti-sigma factor
MAAKVNVGLLITLEGEVATFKIQGSPTIQRLSIIEKQLLASAESVQAKSIVWDLSELDSMDSALALLIAKDIQNAKNSDKEVVLSAMKSDVKKMLTMAEEHAHFGSHFMLFLVFLDR